MGDARDDIRGRQQAQATEVTGARAGVTWCILEETCLIPMTESGPGEMEIKTEKKRRLGKCYRDSSRSHSFHKRRVKFKANSVKRNKVGNVTRINAFVLISI